MRQGIENPGLLLNRNAHFCQNPVVCEARICAKGFNAIFSNEVSSLATFVMNYLVKNKYFSHQYGVIFTGCFWLAYHFLCFFSSVGVAFQLFFFKNQTVKGSSAPILSLPVSKTKCQIHQDERNCKEEYMEIGPFRRPFLSHIQLFCQANKITISQSAP